MVAKASEVRFKVGPFQPELGHMKSKKKSLGISGMIKGTFQFNLNFEAPKIEIWG